MSIPTILQIYKNNSYFILSLFRIINPYRKINGQNVFYMKDFLKMTLATLAGLLIFGVASTFVFFSIVGALASLGQSKPVMPREGVLKIDMSEIVLSEQTTETDPMTLIQGGTTVSYMGIRDAIQAVNTAVQDPAIKFIYLRPDGASGGLSKMEEFRKALENFRNSGKAVVSYIETPTNAGYYLASVSDKIYMSSYQGGMNLLGGISTQMLFLKDILDKIGVNVQLIRHGKYKSAGEMYIKNSPSPENMEQNREMVASVWNSWVKEIAESRDIEAGDFNRMLDNLELNFPEDFIENGLVDEALTKDELRNRLCNLYVTDDYRNIHLVSFKDYATLTTGQVNTKATDNVAVIYANGEIVDGKNDMELSGDRFAKILAEVREDKSIKAVVLRVNSPGGSVMASEKIKNEIDLTMQVKPVIASYGDYAASGGYWISSNCTKIFSNATTLTGSIGVFSMIPDFSKAINDKLHINITAVNSNKHSDMYSLHRPLDAKETAYMQAGVEKVYEKFTSIVSKGRGMSVEDVDAIAQGRVWSGADAMKIGLVDEIGTLEDAINYAALSIDGVSDPSQVNVVSYPKPVSTLEMLMAAFSSVSEPEIFNGTPLEGIENAFRNWNSSESGKVYARMPYIYDIR